MARPLRIVVLGDVSDWNMPSFDLERVPAAYRQMIADCDLLVANLEGPLKLTADPLPTRARLSRYGPIDAGLAAAIQWTGKPQPIVYTRPPILDVLRLAPQAVVTLANNHVKDLGPDAVGATMRRLEKEGFEHVGVGEDRRTVKTTAHVSVRGHPVAVLNYNTVGLRRYGLFANIFGAKRGEPGAAYETPAEIADRIAAIRRDRPGVWVLLVVHAGRALAPTLERAEIDHERYAALGADVVVFHHPHRYYPSPTPGRLFLGDFLFRDDDLPDDRAGGFARLEVEPGSNRLLQQEEVVYHLTEGYPVEPPGEGPGAAGA